MIYEKNKKDTFKCLTFSFSLLLLIPGTYLVNVIYGTIVDIRILTILVILPIAIVGLLWLDYHTNSTKGKIHIGPKSIDISLNDASFSIDKSEISKAIVYGTPSVYRKSFFRVLPFEAFHYVDISLMNGESIIITSLSDYELYWNLLKEPILKGKLFLFKGGWLKRGELVNSIWLNGQK